MPLRIVESRFGSSIRGEVLGDLLPSLLEEATREAGLRPAAPPQISQLDHEPGGSLTFTAALDIWPEIKAEHYEKLAATRMVHEVADEEIGEHLEELRRRHATERVVEAAIGQGRRTRRGFTATSTTAACPSLAISTRSATSSSATRTPSSPEFEEALVGMGAGEERKVPLHLPRGPAQRTARRPDRAFRSGSPRGARAHPARARRRVRQGPRRTVPDPRRLAPAPQRADPRALGIHGPAAPAQ